MFKIFPMWAFFPTSYLAERVYRLEIEKVFYSKWQDVYTLKVLNYDLKKENSTNILKIYIDTQSLRGIKVMLCSFKQS